MLTKPADEDSDDDEQIQQATAGAQNTAGATAAAAHGATSPSAGASREYTSPSPAQSPADSLSGNLSGMSINNASMQSFGELDKLRDRQRVQIMRSNTSRGLPTPGVYSDLQGLNFDPLQPQHAVETRDNYSQGNLSDYSDYT